AIQSLQTIPGWQDADALILVCQQKIQELKAKAEAERLARERSAEQARLKAVEEARKRKQRSIILSVVAVVAVAVFLLVTKVIIPNQKYDAAVGLMNEGKYSQAIAAFTEIIDHKDSSEQIAACETAILDGKYEEAVALMNEGKYSEAIVAFTEIIDHKDSAKQIAACETAILDGKYDAAVALMNEGKYKESYECFRLLNRHKDSKALATVAYQQYKIPELKQASIGDYITFGAYEQDANIGNGKEDIEWQVLAKENNRLLVISWYALDAKPYNETFTSVTWETSTLRKWLNNDFLNAAFGSTEQAMIPTVTVSADKNPDYSTKPGNATQDKVFLLSIPEVNKYFTSDNARKCKPTAYAKKQGVYTNDSGWCWWWLRSPGRYRSSAAYVLSDGGVIEYGYGVFSAGGAVRPALWINLEP
ncbi:MAG: hypothetical protein J6K55_13645, partial [Clostridia bacterium]|nr:hypothetical protein [Clostridia bacterium]